jgi:hypothetical protein
MDARPTTGHRADGDETRRDVDGDVRDAPRRTVIGEPERRPIRGHWAWVIPAAGVVSSLSRRVW